MGEKWLGSYHPKGRKSQAPPQGLLAKWSACVIELLSVLPVDFQVDGGKLLKGPNGLQLLLGRDLTYEDFEAISSVRPQLRHGPLPSAWLQNPALKQKW